MDVQIDDVTTYDFRYESLDKDKNLILNSKDSSGNMDIILIGREIKIDDRILLTLKDSNAHEIESAWRVLSVSSSDFKDRKSYHCLIKYEGLITP